MKISDCDLGWVAGIIEGEGCIGIVTQKDSGHPRTEENSYHTVNRPPHCRTCKLAWEKTCNRSQKVKI